MVKWFKAEEIAKHVSIKYINLKSSSVLHLLKKNTRAADKLKAFATSRTYKLLTLLTKRMATYYTLD